MHNKKILKFDKNGKFSILHITDWHNSDQPYSEPMEFVETVLDKYKPDLVVMTGDMVTGGWFLSTPFSVMKAIEGVVSPVNRRKIPFVFCFGNHDEETYCPKTYQMNRYRKYSECLVPFRFSYRKGFGDYGVEIKDKSGEKTIFNLYLFDSGSRRGSSGSDIVPVSEKQIERYKDNSIRLEKENGKKIPTIIFQHVPLQEVYTKVLSSVDASVSGAVEGQHNFKGKYFVLDKEKYVDGELVKSVGGGTENKGEYDAFLERNDVLAVFFGHDHYNDYLSKTDEGILLGATRTCGFESRGDGAKRGVRLITLDENDIKNIETKSILYCDEMKTEIFPPHKRHYRKGERVKNIPKYIIEGLLNLFTPFGTK